MYLLLIDIVLEEVFVVVLLKIVYIFNMAQSKMKIIKKLHLKMKTVLIKIRTEDLGQ